MDSGSFTKQNLLYPLDQKCFFEKFWLKEPFLSLEGKNVITPFIDLVSLNDIEMLISSLSSSEAGSFEIVKPDIRLDKSRYLNDSMFIDLNAVFQAYANGYTLLFTKAHKRISKVADLVREYEKLFLRNACLVKSPVRASIVLTPKFSVGFPVHYDDYGIFILQVSGEKSWYVYDRIDQYPLTEGRPVRIRQEQQKDLKLLHNFNMKPGNWCYLPRGYYHNAETHNQHSMHIVIAAKSFTALDLLSKVLEIFPECRQPLPVWVTNEIKAGNIKEGIINRMANLNRCNVIKENLQNLHEENMRNMDILPGNGFSSINDLGNINTSIMVSVKKGVILELVGNKLVCGGLSSYIIDDKYKKIIPFMQKNQFFKVSDLPNILVESEKIAFVKQLALDGVLTISKFDKLKKDNVYGVM